MKIRLVFLISAVFLGFVVFALAYPYASSGGVLTGY